MGYIFIKKKDIKMDKILCNCKFILDPKFYHFKSLMSDIHVDNQIIK